MNSQRFHIDDAVWQWGIGALNEADLALLERVREAMPIAADVARSDLFLLLLGADDRICVAAHAQPHSMASLYQDSPAGRCYGSSERRWLWTAIRQGSRRYRIQPEAPQRTTEIAQQTWPILDHERRPLGSLVVYTNAIERERHRRREPAFRHSLDHFLQMAAAGMVRGAAVLPPFHEQDGILYVDHSARYRYLSGQANNVYRRLGYLDDLRGRSVDEVAAGDFELIRRAWEGRACVFSEDTVRGRILLRSVIPLLGSPALSLAERLTLRRRLPDRYGAFVLVKDVTEQRQKAQELKVKALLIREVHHRVKNNLQLLVSIMRMQARRASGEEARQLLFESTNRILSMSAIHESLSEGEDQVLNLREIVQRIIGHVQQGSISPMRNIQLQLGDSVDILLPTNKATACALVVNELLLNAVEHGFAQDVGGRVVVCLYDLGGEIELRIEDNGRGLPQDFSLESESSLGLDIVHTLVHDDLKGTFMLHSLPRTGARATIRFPKEVSGGHQ